MDLLTDRIKEDMKASMKGGNKTRLGVIRLILAAIKQVEVDERLFSDEVKNLQALSGMIEKQIKDLLGVTCKARLVEPRTITRSEGKAKRVIDNRNVG